MDSDSRSPADPLVLRVTVDDAGGSVTARAYRTATTPDAVLILAHGAGAGQDSPFITTWARAWAGLGLEVVTFNFPYTERGRRLPDRAPVLEACYRAVVAAVQEARPRAADALFIGGKSMGGRMATHIAAADPGLAVQGLVLLGYPLHPPGTPEKRRDAHLPLVRRPMLFVQGSRDTFGPPQELAPVLDTLSPPPVMRVVDGGDHSFRVAGARGAAQGRLEHQIRQEVAAWIVETLHRGRRDRRDG